MSNIIQRLIWPSKKLVKQVIADAETSNQRIKSTGRGVLVKLPRESKRAA